MITIYCDVVFAVNYICDFVLLYVTSRFLNIAPGMLKINVASLAGGFFSLAATILINVDAIRVVLCVCFSLVMCRIAFGKGSKARFVRICLTFNAVGCILCGFAVAISGFVTYNIFDGGINVWILLLSAAMLCFGIVFFGSTVSQEKVKKKVTVKVCYDGKIRTCNLLCDSGNLLTDPYSALPVIVLKNENCPEDTGSVGFVKNKTRYIPVKTAEGNSMIRAIKPEYIRLVNDGCSKDINAIIGFSENKLADFGGTDGIIPYSLIENL